MAQKGKNKKGLPPTPMDLLARPKAGKEYLDTPGPYSYNDDPYSERIPIKFSTGPRFPKAAVAKKDVIEYDPTAVEPATKVAVISDADRWAPAVMDNTLCYDVERGMKFTQPQSFAATIGNAKSPAKPAGAQHVPDQNYLTMGHTKIRGGGFTTFTRDTAEHFYISASSPGPIYAPSHNQVDKTSRKVVFSSQPREQTSHTIGPGPMMYADSFQQAVHLSTRPRSPAVIFSNVPNASAMPFPYNAHNICNSKSMRTDFCISTLQDRKDGRVRDASQTRQTPSSSKRPPLKRAASTEPSARPASRTPKPHTPPVVAQRPATPIGNPWDSPFRKAAVPAFHNTSVALDVDDAARANTSMPGVHNASAMGRPATPAALSPEPANADRYAYAPKFPGRFRTAAAASAPRDDCNASGGMRDILTEANRGYTGTDITGQRDKESRPRNRWPQKGMQVERHHW
jgi:hypothetical protein